MSEETWQALRGEINNFLHNGNGSDTKTLRAAIDTHEHDEAGEKKPAAKRTAKPKEEDAG